MPSAAARSSCTATTANLPATPGRWRPASEQSLDAAVLDGGWRAWAGDDANPVERLTRYERLVHVGWLADLLAGEAVEAQPSADVLVFHVNFGVPEEYADGHIPGALLPRHELARESRPTGTGGRPPSSIGAAMRSGITADTTVILYGRDTEGDANEKWPGRRAGQIAATRAALILRYAGVDDVRLLDGGYDWWVRDGHPLETTPRQPVAVPAFGADPGSPGGDRRPRRGEGRSSPTGTARPS